MTKITNHTPVPWAISKYGTIQDEFGHTIPIKGVSLISGKKAEANAILFAAAPEMLALLIEAKDILTNKQISQHSAAFTKKIDELLER